MAGVRNTPSNGGSGREICDWLEHLINPWYGNMLTGKEAQVSCRNTGMGSGDVCGINFKTPIATSAFIDFSIEFDSTGRLLYTLYEGSGYGGGSLGTAILPYWTNRNQGGTPSLAVYVYPTPDTKGTELVYVAQGASGKFGGAGASGEVQKMRLKTDTYYLAEVESKADDMDMSFVATWDEVDG